MIAIEWKPRVDDLKGAYDDAPDLCTDFRCALYLIFDLLQETRTWIFTIVL